ncbi:MAG: two-component system response regulator, partial [Methylococcaceae bacterium]
GSDTAVVERPVIEISLMQLKVGMEIEIVYFENKPYLKNCIVDQKIINNIIALRENTGKDPVIKVLMGKK